MGFRVLPIFPIVQAKTALPWFGHAQIVLQLRESGKGGLVSPNHYPLTNGLVRPRAYGELVVFDRGNSNTKTNEDDASKAVQGLAHAAALEKSG
jgi:hypothetical protein